MHGNSPSQAQGHLRNSSDDPAVLFHRPIHGLSNNLFATSQAYYRGAIRFNALNFSQTTVHESGLHIILGKHNLSPYFKLENFWGETALFECRNQKWSALVSH